MRLTKCTHIVIAVVIALLTGAFCPSGFSYASSDTPAAAVYSTYKFGKAENFINIGVQPMAMPEVIITETMSRDAVLYDMLRKMGMEIRFFPFFKGSDVNEFLLRGDLQVGVGGDMPAIVATSTDKVVVMSLMQYGFTSIVARKHMRIKDLRCQDRLCLWLKRAHYALLNALSIGGNTPKDAHLVKLNVTEMADALKARKIDAFSAWDPAVTEALITLPGVEVIYNKLVSGYLYCRKDFYTSRPDAVDAIVASEIRALNWLRRNKNNLLMAAKWALDKQAAFSGNTSPLTPEQIAAIALNDLIGMKTDPSLPMDEFAENGMLHDEFDFLKTIKFIPPAASLNTVYKNFEPSIIERIANNPARYRLNEYRYR
ncbi:MAG: ABC transporter substrate-binding protein [Nitrospirae bacterium]|nr:ABC transporter substrate-binding protein [Nitrospirota bacterium]